MNLRFIRAGLRGLAFSVLLVACATSALAQVVINQSRAVAGGITPGDAAGFPIRISGSGSFKLTGNLTVPAGLNGIEVVGANVTLDLNGFTIKGTGPSGVEARGVEGLTVYNGTVTGFQTVGIRCGRDCAIRDVRAVRNGTGLAVGFGSIVARNLITRNVSTGLYTEGAVVIESNVISESGYGVVIGAPNGSRPEGGSTLTGNTIAMNDVYAILVQGDASSFNGFSGVFNNTLWNNRVITNFSPLYAMIAKLLNVCHYGAC